MPAHETPGAPAAAQTNQQYGRYAPAATSQEASAFSQKPYEPFGQQNPSTQSQSQSQSQSQFDSFPSQPSQTQSQQSGAPYSSGPSDYYSADPQSRNQYNYYGQQYGQQHHQNQQHHQAQHPQQSGPGHQDTQSSHPNQRSFSGYNASQPDNLSQYPQSGLHQQSRYGAAVASDAHNSGHTTPNPSTQQAPASQPQTHGQQPHSSYGGYTHPYYNSPYYNYMYNQGGYNQGAYGGGPYGKGGVYGQPYGAASGPYDHSSSQSAGFGGQSSLHRADSGLGSGLDNFARTGASQTGAQQGVSGSGFGGGVHDPFGRNASTFQSQAGQSFGNASQPAASSSNDDLKPFGETKSGAGPSPSLGGARPGSATQNVPSGPGSLPPQQSNTQAGYSGYPSHLQGQGGLHGSGYNVSGSGASAQHNNTPYSYGQGFGSYYQGGQGQGQGQQQRGWGGNYH